MVKLYCDRCRKEIQSRYYTIGFDGYSVNSEYENAIGAISGFVSNVRNGALDALNAQKMYCTECKADIECFCTMAPNNRMKA